MALVEWGLTPEYLNATWTEELLNLMLRARGKRFERMNTARSETPAVVARGNTREEEFAAVCFSKYTQPSNTHKDTDVAAKLKELEKYGH